MTDRTIYGVDFSGAEDAGRAIWIARGEPDGEDLVITALHPAEELPYGGRDRHDALYGLHMLVRTSGRAAFGLDVPFGLPRALVPDATWRDFVLAFPDRYRDADTFREACRGASDAELKRATDEEAQAPMSPYNHRLYRQTYHAINDVLAPLVKAGAASALPMMPRDPGIPWLLEVCPACTLQELGIRASYKGRSAEHRKARETLLAEVEAREHLILEKEHRALAVRDQAGDALDSCVAAAAAHRAVANPPGALEAFDAATRLEGHIHV